MEEEWKAIAEIEAVLHNTSRLTTIFQHKEKLNDAYTPIMRKTKHDGLSSGSLEETCVEILSKNRFLIHPKKIDSDSDDFTIT